jgi:alkylation response protein AidB-like acyl-CoA dehydrogenase
MPNFYEDNQDLRFYVEKAIDWNSLVELTEYRYQAKDGFANAEEAVEFYKSVLEMVGDFVANEVAPKAKEIDRSHPRLENGDVLFPPVLNEIFEHVRQLELHGMCIPRELGGMNCPFLLFLITTELMARADVSVAAHVGFHGGMALAMLVFSIMENTTEFDVENVCIKDTRFREYIEEIIAGEAWGSMDITEPGAGSDMAAMTTRGEQDTNGNWYLTGQKIFITSGHAKYHFVIARTEETKKDDAFAGLKGLSMFLAPTYRTAENGEREYLAKFTAVEEKLGHHGSATVAISYDHTPACLIGKRGEGFRLMLLMMNNARVGVGFESLGLCESAWRLAKSYAAERTSMGKTLDQHEMIADYLAEMETDIQAIRALSMAGAREEERVHRLGILMNVIAPKDQAERDAAEKEIDGHRSKSRRITPLVKYLGAEKAVEMSRRCIQIHGGFGYTQEYGAEKLLRDAMVLPIYEGTSQIQSLMVMKDSLMGVLKSPGVFTKSNIEYCWRSWFGASRAERQVARLQARSCAAIRYLMRRLFMKKLGILRGQPLSAWGKEMKDWDPKRDFAPAMLHAERLTRMLVDVAVCEVLLEQAQRFPERQEVLERYMERAEPRSRFLYNEITTTGTGLLERLEGRDG